MKVRGQRGVRRPRLLVFNQYYWPGVEATAHLLGDLCAALADDFDITVVTGALRGDPEVGTFSHEGVRVVRVRSTAYDRRRLLLRGLNYLTYLAQSLRAGFAADKPDVVLCMTDPPVIADAALVVARRFRAPLVVISQDVFPEIAVQLGRLQNPIVVGALRMLIGFYLRRADRVVAIGETMRDRLVEKGAAPDRITLIQNWVDAEAIRPAPRDNEWAQSEGLVGKFVVMHSGNVGHAQNLDALVRAATFLRDVDDLAITIIGTGARHLELIELAERLEVDSVRFLPYQPREALSLSLSAGALHFVGLARGLAGYVVPSRLYGILSAGRPVLVSADPESETARIVARVGCGIVLPPGRPDLIAETIRAAHEQQYDLDAMGARGREFVLNEADRPIAIGRYRNLIGELVGAGGGG
jgi:colanic acid biosynthesis glycosyl transferase WcaI